MNHMFRLGIKDVEFVVCNTDQQALDTSPVPSKLQIGDNITEGLGCGANPEVGKAAAVESRDKIRELLQGTKMVFITAGMGGGTGTGAAPVIANIAKDLDILSVGIVTVPFGWEGKKKLALANQGINELRESCDTVLVILNDKLREIYGNLAIGEAFGQADNVLTTAAKSIAEIITLAGHINVDFQDVRTVMLNAGAAVMGTSDANGENRARKAAEGALTSPLLDNRDIMGAKKILLSIISGADAELSMDELTEITDFIQDQAGQEAEVIFGHGVDDDLGESIRVTIIATGFAGEERRSGENMEEPGVKRVHELERGQIWLFEADNSVNETGEIQLHNEGEEKKTDPAREEPPMKKTPMPKEEPRMDEPERKFVFDLPSAKKGEPEEPVEDHHNEDEEEEDGLFVNTDDEFTSTHRQYSDEIVGESGEMELRTERDRLRQQAMERKEHLMAGRKHEMTKEEFNEKWSLPAYLRRGVKMENVPHSSEPFISKYNLNDDNSILGNNRFLHDNVD